MAARPGIEGIKLRAGRYTKPAARSVLTSRNVYLRCAQLRILSRAMMDRLDLMAEYPQNPDRRRRRRPARARSPSSSRCTRSSRPIAVETGAKGVAGRQGRPDRPRDHGCRPARHRRPRGGAHAAQERLQGAGHHADRPRHRFRHHPRARIRRQRLRHQAVPLRGAAGAHPRAAAPARGERGRGLHHRPVHVPAGVETAAQSRRATRCG